MLQGNDKLFEEVRRAKLEEIELPPELEQLGDWVSEQYDVDVLYIVYDQFEIPTGEDRPRLNLIFDTEADFERLHDAQGTLRQPIKMSVLRQFRRIIDESGLDEKYDTVDLHLICEDFSHAALSRAANQFRSAHQNELTGEFPDCPIWKLHGSGKHNVVFYHTDEDLAECDDNGCSDEIEEWFLESIKPFDEFDYIQADDLPLEFDSKQNLDANYQGSLYLYFQE